MKTHLQVKLRATFRSTFSVLAFVATSLITHTNSLAATFIYTGGEDPNLFTVTAEDILIIDWTSDQAFLNTTASEFIHADVYLKDWGVNGIVTATSSRIFEFTNSLSDYRYAPGAIGNEAVQSIIFDVAMGNNVTTLQFSGDLRNFSGDIISYTNNVKLEFLSASAESTQAERNASASGTGALESYGQRIFYNMTGDVIINNSSITVLKENPDGVTYANNGILSLNNIGGSTYSISSNIRANRIFTNAMTTLSGQVYLDDVVFQANVHVTGAGSLNIGSDTALSISNGISIVAGDMTLTKTAGGTIQKAEGAANLVVRASSISYAEIAGNIVTLTDNGTGSIINSTISNVELNLGVGSTLELDNVTQRLGTIIDSGEGHINLLNHKLEENVGSGIVVPDLVTIEATTEDMLVYSINSIQGNITLDGSPTLNLVITDAEEFKTTYGIVAFEIVGFDTDSGSRDKFLSNYSNVTINVYSESLEGELLYANSALGYTKIDNGAGGTNLAFYIYAPEPSSATLSILALAGFLARKRRKAV